MLNSKIEIDDMHSPIPGMFNLQIVPLNLIGLSNSIKD